MNSKILQEQKNQKRDNLFNFLDKLHNEFGTEEKIDPSTILSSKNIKYHSEEDVKEYKHQYYLKNKEKYKLRNQELNKKWNPINNKKKKEKQEESSIIV